MRQAIFPELTRGESPPGELAPARARAHQILREAEREAQALVEAARQSSAARVEEAYREGWLQGRAEAVAQAGGQIQQVAAGLGAAAAQLCALAEEFRAQAGETIVSLALAVAEGICRREMLQDPDAVLRSVRAALALLPEPAEIRVRLHPDQLALIQQHRDELLGTTETVTSIRLLPDPSIEPGGCLVEAPGCLLEATLAAQLEEAGRRLRGDPQ